MPAHMEALAAGMRGSPPAELTDLQNCLLGGGKSTNSRSATQVQAAELGPNLCEHFGRDGWCDPQSAETERGGS